MTWLILPVVLAATSAFGGRVVQRRLRPDWATWILTGLSVLTAVAVLWALGVLALGFAAEQPALAGAFGWCSTLVKTHRHIPVAVGVGAGIALVASGVSVVVRVRAWRIALRTSHAEIVDADEPIAFAVPGRPGRIVVSAGMLATLDPDEQRVLYAHERAHLRRNHHRFVGAADLAAAAVPLLVPLARLVRFATERWADEDAATEVGDRRLVARAVTRAALAGSGPAPAGVALGIAGAGSRARVESLMRPAITLSAVTVAWIAAAVGVLTISLVGSTVQIRDLVALLSHVCGPD